MKKLSALFAGALLTASFSSTAFAASPDIYVMNFRDAKSADSQTLDAGLDTAIAVAGTNAQTVVIDTSTAAKWEASAHDALRHDLVPLFNKWVGLPGFAAVVDADTKRVIGCVNARFSMNEMADELRRMSAQANRQGYVSKASTRAKSTQCPPAFNQPPQ